MSSKDPQFILHPKKNNEPNSIWRHFYIAKDKQSAKCKICPNKIIMTRGGSTKGLHNHYAVHKKPESRGQQQRTVAEPQTDSEDSEVIVIDEPGPSSSLSAPKKRKISDYYIMDGDHEDNSLEAVIARMTSLDGLPFRVFIVSKDLRKGLEARGFVNLPTSSTTIKDKVVMYCEKVFNSFSGEMKSLRQKGRCFSVTFDEWTSTANKRYININVHGCSEQQRIKIWNIGLIRAKGSIPAETCVILVKEKLAKFGLSLKDDIVCITTDGASVMVKVGKQIDALQQLCFAHGIHLAVMDVLYSKRGSAFVQENNPTESEESENDNTGNDDEDHDDDEALNDGLELVEECNADVSFELTSNENVATLVTKVRKIVKLFRRSPLKNTVLQNYVKSKYNKELNLILDCHTRWNSLAQMLERFVALKDCLQKAMIDLSIPITLCDQEFEVLRGIVKCLEPIRLTVLALCRQDANLYTADASFKFLFEELSKVNIPLSTQLQAALKLRLQQRRTMASTVLSYLCNPKAVKGKQDLGNINEQELFQTPDKKEVARFIEKLIRRLSSPSTVQQDNSSASDDDVPLSEFRLKDKEQEEAVPLSLEEKLSKVIDDAVNVSTCSVTAAASPDSKSLAKMIKKEMTLFENGGYRGRNLQLCYEHLHTVPPTSVESERAFSVAGSFSTKIRSKLGDESLNALVALRSYFLSK